MTPDRLPHEQSASAVEAAWFQFRRVLSGPVGCLVMIVLLPIVAVVLLVLVVAALWKGRKLGQAIQAQLDAERGRGGTTFAGGAFAGGDPGRGGPAGAEPQTLAVAEFVRIFAPDPSFSRDEASQAAVPAASGRSARELLDDAIRRGWIEELGGRLHVSDRGRSEAEALLRSRGM